MRQIILDTETTGLNARNGDRIVEIGCVELVNRRLTGNTRHFYVNADRDSDPEALAVHGLTTGFLRDKPRFEEIAIDLLAFVRDADVIIHNAPFDVGFLDAELRRAGLPLLAAHCRRIIDTLALARQMFPGKRNSLDALCERLEIDNTHRTLHGGLIDAELLAGVYIAMTRGQESLLVEPAVDEPADACRTMPAIRRAALELPVVLATDGEMAAHEAVLDDIENTTGKTSVWRHFAPPEPGR
ncbi:DNA polymerase III subunit epsilon [Burkholderia sp. Ac-20384]|uniref:DNA polymerase III subunit epsilon n=1 Tax=Burkholderia lata (strain ATCC 17760 / DSM 23089 / LMG 22485 / NCIMB 9086 / R18194 / 383) TaxID=482957 RepID=A0A833PSZ4_BURL3|nr:MULTISPECIES: DNA polymerase III subunit epsilon [Burkholderia]KAF1035331.1 MAG: DNA polymerase III subunit epsilon [Burkholderia lata]MBN3823321.1 DNA polymerase III subunit epsilon [Burkholderia sp. Ac-20384]